MNKWILYEKYILHPLSEEIKKTGLNRASRYRVVTYKELIDFYEIRDLLLESSYSYLNKKIANLKDSLYIIPVTTSFHGEEMVDPVLFDALPQKNDANGEKESLHIIDDSFAKFSQLIKGISSDYSVEKNIQILLEESDLNHSHEKLLQWVNQNGLLFSAPISQMQNLPHYLKDDIEIYDFLYHLIRLEYKGTIPYFMSMELLKKLNDYCAWLLVGCWIYKLFHGEFIGANVQKPSEEEYGMFCVKFAKEIEGANFSLEEGYFTLPEIKKHFKAMLANNLTQWIGYHIVEGFSTDRSGEIRFSTRFSSQSLMGAMSLGQYSLLVNQHSKYIKCLNPKCGLTFAAQQKRRGAIYCSDSCRVAGYRSKKAHENAIEIEK